MKDRATRCVIPMALSSTSCPEGPFVTHSKGGGVWLYDHGSGTSRALAVSGSNESCTAHYGEVFDDRPVLVHTSTGLVELRTDSAAVRRLISDVTDSAISPDGTTIAAAGYNYEAQRLTLVRFDLSVETMRILRSFSAPPLRSCGYGEPGSCPGLLTRRASS
ncbi:MAG TPA: hypothetical protein VM600_05950 [Actinomycetota bacterium]|nr:hypothetical protein [Actinomycetota bacterium]